MEEIILDQNVEQREPEVLYAGFWIRVLASLIDTCVFIPFYAFSVFNFFFLKSWNLELLFLLLRIIYKPLMEYKYGATLGKMAVKVKVVNYDYEGLSLSQALIRYIPFAITELIGIISSYLVYSNPEFINVDTIFEVAKVQSSGAITIVQNIFVMILLISCLFVAFNEKKKGLHDMMAKTYCIKKSKN